MKKTYGNLFTLIELLVVIAILTILMALLLPTLKLAKEYTKLTLCVNNLKQVGVGVNMYSIDWDGWGLYESGNVSGRMGITKELGILYSQNYLKSPHVLFCPASKYAPGWDEKFWAWSGSVGTMTGGPPKISFNGNDARCSYSVNAAFCATGWWINDGGTNANKPYKILNIPSGGHQELLLQIGYYRGQAHTITAQETI